MFRDQTLGVAAVHIIDGRFVVHSQLFGEVGKEKLARVLEVNDAIDDAFRSKGVEKLHTWAQTDEQYRYNLFLGYVPTGEEVTFDGVPIGVHEFEKVL